MRTTRGTLAARAGLALAASVLLTSPVALAHQAGTGRTAQIETSPVASPPAVPPSDSPAAAAPPAAAPTDPPNTVPAVAAAPPHAAAPPPPQATDRVASPAIGLSVSVVNVRDCSGNVPVPPWGGERNLCAPNTDLVYIAGHNPGPFSSLPRLKVGDAVQYWGPDGALHNYAVRSVEVVGRKDVARAYDDYSPHIVLQTCATADGALDWVVKAYPS